MSCLLTRIQFVTCFNLSCQIHSLFTDLLDYIVEPLPEPTHFLFLYILLEFFVASFKNARIEWMTKQKMCRFSYFLSALMPQTNAECVAQAHETLKMCCRSKFLLFYMLSEIITKRVLIGAASTLTSFDFYNFEPTVLLTGNP